MPLLLLFAFAVGVEVVFAAVFEWRPWEREGPATPTPLPLRREVCGFGGMAGREGRLWGAGGGLCAWSWAGGWEGEVGAWGVVEEWMGLFDACGREVVVRFGGAVLVVGVGLGHDFLTVRLSECGGRRDMG